MPVAPQRTETPCHTTARHLAAHFDAFLIDLWGVVHDGQSLYKDAVHVLMQLVTAEKPVIFLTNTSRRAAGVVSMLDDMGLPRRTYSAVITAGDVAYNLVMPPPIGLGTFGRKAYLVGSQPGDDWAAGPGLERTRSVDAAQFVLAVGLAPTGLDRTEILVELAQMASRGIPFVCANPDRRTVIGDHEVECVGTIADQYELCGGNVIWCGKPATAIFREAIARLDHIRPERICVIGDGLETDIRGGVSAGLATTMIARNGLRSRTGNCDISPHYLMSTLCW